MEEYNFVIHMVAFAVALSYLFALAATHPRMSQTKIMPQLLLIFSFLAMLLYGVFGIIVVSVGGLPKCL